MLCIATPQADPSELAALPKSFRDRDSAIRSGLTLGGRRYEVWSRAGVGLYTTCGHPHNHLHSTQIHQHHPPVMYGRTMDGPVENTEGIALVAGQQSNSRPTWYTVVTYEYVGLVVGM